jgi:hypothetical protein
MTRLQGIGWMLALVAAVLAFIVLLGFALQLLPSEKREGDGDDAD